MSLPATSTKNYKINVSARVEYDIEWQAGCVIPFLKILLEEGRISFLLYHVQMCTVLQAQQEV